MSSASGIWWMSVAIRIMSSTLWSAGQNILFVVTLFRIRHCRKLEVTVVVADNAAQVFFPAVSPGPEFARRKLIPRIDVADFHVIDADFDACVVDAANHVVAELAVVHQSAIADGTVHYPDLLPVGDPLSYCLMLVFAHLAFSDRFVSLTIPLYLHTHMPKVGVNAFFTILTRLVNGFDIVLKRAMVELHDTAMKPGRCLCASSRLVRLDNYQLSVHPAGRE